MAEIERTLVKSPPEIWGLLDDPELRERWLAQACGIEGLPAIVSERDPERLIAWEAPGAARIEVEIAKKGWGTHVCVRAEPETAAPALEAALEELSTPQKRPFTRV